MLVQLGLCRTWSETLSTCFLVTRLIFATSSYCGEGFNKTIISNFERFHMILSPNTPHKHKRFLLTPSNTASAAHQPTRRFAATLKLIKGIALLLFQPFLMSNNISRHMGKPTICICENKDADQLRGNREADRRLCFRYMDSTLPLLLKSEISNF